MNSASSPFVSSVIVIVPDTLSTLLAESKLVICIVGSFTVISVPLSGKLNLIRPTREPDIESIPLSFIRLSYEP